jgi:hypothetical protein
MNARARTRGWIGVGERVEMRRWSRRGLCVVECGPGRIGRRSKAAGRRTAPSSGRRPSHGANTAVRLALVGEAEGGVRVRAR